jgi:Leucine-rich repeat (LRR) protein
MQPVIAPKRVLLDGGTWTPKVAGTIEDGNVDAPFVFEGKIEIKELGGHLKMFFHDVVDVKKKISLTEEETETIEKQYDLEFEQKLMKLMENGEDIPTHEQALETRNVEVAALLKAALDAKNDEVVLPSRLFVYLARRKPKTKMNDIARSGTKVHLPADNGSGCIALKGSKGSFQASLKDVPDALAYQGCVIVKMPGDLPKTEQPLVFAVCRFQSAKSIKIHSVSQLGISDLNDVLSRLLKDADPSTRGPTKATDAIKSSSYYSHKAKNAWAKFHKDLDDEVEFDVFLKMLDSVDIFLCDAQAKRIFLAVDVDGSGEMGVSEFENFLMAYDVLGQAGADLAALDIYESLKMMPSAEFGEFSNHEGLDLSGFMEASEMLGLREGVEEEDLLRAFGNGKKKDLDKLFLNHVDFKKAWLKVADLSTEFIKRGLKYDPSPMAQARARERLNRIITDQEDAYLDNLKKINDIVENVKKDRRQKKDDKKRDKGAHKEAMLHNAAKFQALRNSEKRLMAKIAEEEKTKKRFEERALRSKLLAQQKDARTRENAEIAGKAADVEKLRSDEVKAAGLDKLDISVRGLRFIPEELYIDQAAQTKLSYLVRFDLSHNILDHLPEVNFFYFMGEVRYLKLSQNRLKVLPDNEFQYLRRLEVLEMEMNQIEVFPSYCNNLTNLQRLDISSNKLVKLPESLGMCANLKYMSAHSNNLKMLPNSLGGCFNLEYIDVARNNLTEVPEDIGFMASLKHLDASTNRIGALPRDIGNCVKLKYLDLSTNIVVFLPESFSKLCSLEICDLQRNEIVMQPGRFNNCTSLKDLRLKRNQSRLISDDIGMCTGLMRIDASNNMIAEIPSEIGLCIALQELDLSYNAMNHVPPELASCGMIQVLDLKHNLIEGMFPETIGLVESLVNLDLSFNKVTSLPESVIGLRKLEILKAEHCQLSALPSTITDLAKLRFLELSNNRFTRFPIELSNLESLKTLNMMNNAMDLLPRAIDGMTGLDTLNLSRNLLKALPVEFVRVLESVPNVELAVNPWNALPEKWGKLWLDKKATDAPQGYIVADAVDFLYGMQTFYDAAESIWVEHGVFHYTNRLGFGDFLEELRRRIPSTWHEGLVDHVKQIYFQSRSSGIFPRWYSLEGHEEVKEENELIREFDKKRREDNVLKAREGALAKDERMAKAYDMAPIIRAKALGAVMDEHNINSAVISNMASTALQHCLSEREVKALKRVERREQKMLRKEAFEMERLKEILQADGDMLDGGRVAKRRAAKKKKVTSII